MNEQNNQVADNQPSMIEKIENSVAAESLADLKLTAAQENDIKAGAGATAELASFFAFEGFTPHNTGALRNVSGSN